jgi:hypothetical protein
MMQGVEVGGKGVLLEVATFREKARIVRVITLFTISAFFFRLRASLFVHTTTCVILNYIFLYQF